ncbi:SH3 domain-containing protein [Leptospira jelokensis]|uniref:SH3 domain-containing protein n=1 Tax=Leptospira jelokensis TaxID=2484931 RepID=A0A4Z1A5Z2_9LEPT|nr:SH3 domain-containing protein [Leptospira jelokensis]TGL65361.1 SH3 domain-containing protein [Leptospira jelokensis]
MVQSKGIFHFFICAAFVACNSSKNIYINGSKATLHERPNEKSKIIRKLTGNTKALILEEVTNDNSDFRHWFKVRLQNRLEGYVYSDFSYFESQNPFTNSLSLPKLKFELHDGKLKILEKNTSKLLDTIDVGNRFNKVFKTKQIRQFLLIVIGYENEREDEYEGVVYDLKKNRVIVRNLSKQILMHICYFESVSPDDQFLVFDSGTSSIRDKFVYDISTSKFHLFESMSLELKWIAPKTFIYYDRMQENETNLPIRKGDYVLEEKRIWRNGTIYRTNTTRYTYQD